MRPLGRRCAEVAGDIEESADKRKPAALLKADDVLGDREVGAGYRDASETVVRPELALENYADAETGGDGFADALAALDFDDRAGSDGCRRQRRLEDAASHRPALAEHHVLPREFGQANAAPMRPGMPVGHEEHQPVGAEGQSEEARIGGELRHYRNIGLVVEKPAQHGDRVAEAERKRKAAMPPLQLGQNRNEIGRAHV